MAPEDSFMGSFTPKDQQPWGKDPLQAPGLQELLAQQMLAIEQAAVLSKAITEQLRQGEAIFTRGPAAGQLVLKTLGCKDPQGEDATPALHTDQVHAMPPSPARSGVNAARSGGARITVDPASGFVPGVPATQAGVTCPSRLDSGVCDLSAAPNLAEPLLAKPKEQDPQEQDDSESDIGSTFSWIRQASADSRYFLTLGAKHRLRGLREEHEFQQRLKDLSSGKEHGEASLYKSDGVCQSVAQSHCFQVTTLVMVMLNVIWIGIDIDFDKAPVLCDAPPIFQVVNNCFCLYFVIEVLLRVQAHRRKCSALQSPWLVFDIVLAGSMAWETWVQVILYRWLGWAPIGPGGATNSLRVLRIFRITRMARLVRMLPELMILVKGMAAGLRSIAAILVLLLLMIYIFGLAFRQLGTFESVPTAMQFLLTQVLCGYDADFFGKMLDDGWVSYLTYLMFMLLASFTLLNMLIGILCSVVSSVSEQAQEDHWQEELEAKVDLMKETMDLHKTGRFSAVELEHMFQNPGEYMRLHELGVDFVALLHYLRLFVTEKGDISWDDFKQVLMKCDAGRTVTLKDLVEHRQYLSMELSSIASHVNKIVDRL